MPTIQVEAQVSNQELLRAVKQLSPPEFQQFVTGVLALRAERQAPRLTSEEETLLLQINRGLPEELRLRNDTLLAKRQSCTLTLEEQAELIGLTDQIEEREAERVTALAELARLRKTTIGALARQLGIPASSNGN